MQVYLLGSIIRNIVIVEMSSMKEFSVENVDIFAKVNSDNVSDVGSVYELSKLMVVQ